MARTIEQVITFSAPAADLYEVYMDSEKHTAATGAPAQISREVGGAFTAHGGYLTGQTIALTPGAMVVQRWHCNGFPESDLDSILVLTFHDTPAGGEVRMTHANVPDAMYDSLKNGWNTSYWTRWTAYLANRQAGK